MRAFYLTGILSIALLVGHVPAANSQTSSTAKALEALDKALEKPAPIERKTARPPLEQKSAPEKNEAQKNSGTDMTEKGIPGAPEVYLGMTCKQVKATLGTFTEEDCCDRKKQCSSAFKIIIDKLPFYCYMTFDDNGMLRIIILTSDNKSDIFKDGKLTATEWHNKYLEKINSAYGTPSKFEENTRSKKRWWFENGRRLFLSIENDKSIAIGIGNL
ncbi:MAG: hypothetical protein B193_1935 [Solidesulfovibrio magneticus str. Maddingley MBC34]|uniref:Uncharacterized protein n=1 Tax=Solidesulfovibrio magneticus str. Maddingley MBC34 TaxID=1206767 RepID=K6GQS8_9BACT|nr:MAG: hypothetical protein B193_1935 [Solidesulfovibrio magneticus str. Maddingley MBC34]